jgi:hypothetical protein
MIMGYNYNPIITIWKTNIDVENPSFADHVPNGKPWVFHICGRLRNPAPPKGWLKPEK